MRRIRMSEGVIMCAVSILAVSVYGPLEPAASTVIAAISI